MRLTGAYGPCAVQVFRIGLVAVRHPARRLVLNVRHTPTKPPARCQLRVAVYAAPPVVAVAKPVARAPGNTSHITQLQGSSSRAAAAAADAHAAAVALVEVRIVDKQAVDAQSAAGGVSEAPRYK